MDFPISTTPEQAIDAEALASLRVIGGDDPGFVEEMIVLFLEQAPRHLEVIGSALAEGDLSRITKAAHHLKASSFYLGARKLSDLCARTEAQARAGNKNAVIDLITALKVEYEMVQLALQKQLGA